MSSAKAFAKLNLALVVGPLVAGKHEVVTVLQAIDLHDGIELEPADGLSVEGFAEDTLVRDALGALAAGAGVEPHWRVRIDKRIPVAAGLGGGSSDAATALRLASATLPEPFEPERLHELAARLGADVPFFLEDTAQLATGDGSELSPLDLPHDYVVLLVLPSGQRKESTEAVYDRFDERRGEHGFDDRRARLLAAVAEVEQSSDLAKLPRNDLASSPLAAELERLGAFRADVSGAGPAVYGLFEREPEAARAAATLVRAGQTWIVRPLAGARNAGG